MERKHPHPDKNSPRTDAKQFDSQGYADDTKFTSPDKYLALEQKGVRYTGEGHPESNSDYFEWSNEEGSEKYRLAGRNSRNAEAFNQDDYILKDNLGLDQDQNLSVSSDTDDPNTSA
ncbi:hypothetical protein [Flavobacterium caeni]|uniref:Uncharacterized protein n=1 Tax=Flavobacterium caeni TaxID=490189 RepID=A0A1G5J8J8_9FLAO|nr:hypothetical protein [Flavobacterium caeni]SCY84159.1 hypothetical protein SAMN02927903_02582 [Flavobacterium caeni]